MKNLKEAEVRAVARPSKTVGVLENEGRSHRTKEELETRKAAEQAALTGKRMREAPEVSRDKVAHAEWLRVRLLLEKAGKDDALYEAVINEYCLAKSDIARYMQLRDEIQLAEMEAAERLKLSLECDNMIEKYRKKRFDIEKENGMTIASSARSIPKKAAREENPLLKILNE